jgi:hypothetical protein
MAMRNHSLAFDGAPASGVALGPARATQAGHGACSAGSRAHDRAPHAPPRRSLARARSARSAHLLTLLRRGPVREEQAAQRR